VAINRGGQADGSGKAQDAARSGSQHDLAA
jgi:hypothetical protein